MLGGSGSDERLAGRPWETSGVKQQSETTLKSTRWTNSGLKSLQREIRDLFLNPLEWFLKTIAENREIAFYRSSPFWVFQLFGGVAKSPLCSIRLERLCIGAVVKRGSLAS